MGPCMRLEPSFDKFLLHTQEGMTQFRNKIRRVLLETIVQNLFTLEMNKSFN